jgi:uncharacterized membrane protein
MDTNKFQESLNETTKNVKKIVDLKLELYTLIVIERISKAFTNFLAILISTIFIIFFLIFLAFVFVAWYEVHFGSRVEGYLITAAFFVILAVVVYFSRNVLFLNPMIQGFTEAAFEKEETLNNIKKDKDEDE